MLKNMMAALIALARLQPSDDMVPLGPELERPEDHHNGSVGNVYQSRGATGAAFEVIDREGRHRKYL